MRHLRRKPAESAFFPASAYACRLDGKLIPSTKMEKGSSLHAGFPIFKFDLKAAA
jgi:hypothetical protein